MKILSLFDGISCGLQSLKELNFPITNYYASEIDENAIAISNKNHPEIIRLGDVNNINFNDYKDIDLILAGSPCQGFSKQGFLKGLEDDRSKLFYKFIEALRIIQPKYFLLENVKMKKEWKEIIDKETGVKGLFINSGDFSVQSRKRYYWTNIQLDINTIQKNTNTIFDIIDDTANNYFNDEELEKIKNNNWNTTRDYYNKTQKYMDTKYPTLWGTNYGYGCVPLIKINNRYRLLSLLELERLQTLPDNYTYLSELNKTQRYRAISNSWNVATIKWILTNL